MLNSKGYDCTLGIVLDKMAERDLYISKYIPEMPLGWLVDLLNGFNVRVTQCITADKQ